MPAADVECLCFVLRCSHFCSANELQQRRQKRCVLFSSEPSTWINGSPNRGGHGMKPMRQNRTKQREAKLWKPTTFAMVFFRGTQFPLLGCRRRSSLCLKIYVENSRMAGWRRILPSAWVYKQSCMRFLSTVLHAVYHFMAITTFV
jgi:hypothetical protein